mmetsp:Transcript_3665/g.8371  ORF Transcript_3665/g.8371 Transcript_3665/m.8371 type:complete len:567 (+) Transcript_3665:98-1798(+)
MVPQQSPQQSPLATTRGCRTPVASPFRTRLAAAPLAAASRVPTPTQVFCGIMREQSFPHEPTVSSVGPGRENTVPWFGGCGYVATQPPSSTPPVPALGSFVAPSPPAGFVAPPRHVPVSFVPPATVRLPGPQRSPSALGVRANSAGAARRMPSPIGQSGPMMQVGPSGSMSGSTRSLGPVTPDVGAAVAAAAASAAAAAALAKRMQAQVKAHAHAHGQVIYPHPQPQFAKSAAVPFCMDSSRDGQDMRRMLEQIRTEFAHVNGKIVHGKNKVPFSTTASCSELDRTLRQQPQPELGGLTARRPPDNSRFVAGSRVLPHEPLRVAAASYEPVKLTTTTMSPGDCTNLQENRKLSSHVPNLEEERKGISANTSATSMGGSPSEDEAFSGKEMKPSRDIAGDDTATTLSGHFSRLSIGSEATSRGNEVHRQWQEDEQEIRRHNKELEQDKAQMQEKIVALEQQRRQLEFIVKERKDALRSRDIQIEEQKKKVQEQDMAIHDQKRQIWRLDSERSQASRAGRLQTPGDFLRLHQESKSELSEVIRENDELKKRMYLLELKVKDLSVARAS